MMPPTRGHDLKRVIGVPHNFLQEDAPHTGARLETRSNAAHCSAKCWMPPTRGHDLKHILNAAGFRAAEDAPHTGARLETLYNFRHP